MVGLFSLENCCDRPKTRKSALEGLREIGRHPVGHVSYSVIKVSDVMREIQS